MKHPPHPKGYRPVINRIEDVMIHLDRFAFGGISKLAHSAGVNQSTVSRILNNQFNPSFALVARLTSVIEHESGLRIDPRDLVAEGGHFLTRYVCDLMGCPGCLPDHALNEFGSLNPAFQGIEPGCWTSSRSPHGYESVKGSS